MTHCCWLKTTLLNKKLIMEDVMKVLVEQLINEFVGSYKQINNTQTVWREPLIGFANSNNGLFLKIKEMIDDNYLLPHDILPEAKTVVSYFIPFTEEMVKTNKGGKIPSREWAVAYVETNILLDELAEHLISSLEEVGVKADMARFPKPGYDTKKVVSYWSQRHVAYACGLGTFGINNMLITDKGCCGRFGSIVIDAKIEPNPVLTEERCLYKINKSCMQCVEACPSNALTEKGFDRFRCYDLLTEYDKIYSDSGDTRVCGKCLACLPCSFKL